MKNRREWRKASGTEYSYFLLRFIIGALIFLLWSSYTELFLKEGFDLFFPLFFIAIFSGIFARIFAYLILYGLSRRTKSTIPSPYQLNFTRNINRFSLVYLVGTVISTLIYAFALDDLIMIFLFPEQSLFAILIVYIIIKAIAKFFSWLFFKIKL